MREKCGFDHKDVTIPLMYAMWNISLNNSATELIITFVKLNRGHFIHASTAVWVSPLSRLRYLGWPCSPEPKSFSHWIKPFIFSSATNTGCQTHYPTFPSFLSFFFLAFLLFVCLMPAESCVTEKEEDNFFSALILLSSLLTKLHQQFLQFHSPHMASLWPQCAVTFDEEAHVRYVWMN